jgi:hypothetical protein
MSRKILFIVGLFFSMHLFAQTGIGTTNPHPSAKLEVSSDKQGFLPPQVSLTGPTDRTTIKNTAGASITPATGLLVYCKGDAGLAEGYYYWNGNAWATIATSGGSGSFAASFMRASRISTQTIAVGGVVTFSNIDNAAGTDISLNTSTGRITLAAGNTYRLRGAVPNFSGGQRPAFIWYNETTSSNIGSATFSYNPGDNASLTASGGMSEVIITPNVSTVISFRLLSSLGSGNITVGANGDFSTTGSYPWFDIQVISGNAPVTGQSVDYVQASLSTNQSLSTAGNIIFNVSSGAGITITSGGFNLIANKTYKLEAALGGTSGGFAYYGWVDNTNTLLPGGSIGAVMKAGNTYTDAPQDKAVVYFTPSVNTTVFLRVYSLSGTLTAYAPSTSSNYSSSWANIVQIGSSAIVNPWVLSGNNVFNTSGNIGLGTSTPTSKLNIAGGGIKLATGFGNSTTRPSLNTGSIGNYEIRGVGGGSTQIDLQDDGFLRLSAGGGTNLNTQSSIDLSGFSTVADMSNNIVMRTGGVERLRIDASGNLNVTGSINLTNPSGNVSTKISTRFTAGDFVNFDNLRFSVTTSGNRGLNVATVSGSAFLYVEATYNNGGVFGSRTTSPVEFTTNPSGSLFGWGFGSSGDTITYHFMDANNSRMYRVTLVIMPSYINNFITIERLL